MQNVTRREFLALAIGAIATAATPRPAEAKPAKFRKCETVTQNGITYLLYKRWAIVTKCAARKSITIPDSIKAGGRRYTVRNVWDGAISGKTKRITLKARHLESVEDAAVWQRCDLAIICSDRATHKWLKSSSARVKLRG